MHDQYAHRSARTLSAPAQLVLPVVVFGETVFQPVRFPDPLVVHVEEGKSYRAMREAMRTDGEVLLVFVAEGELAGFRSSVPQAVPNVGVIARIEEADEPVGLTHRIQMEGLSRADILARIEHAPFYRAACAAHSDRAIEAAGVEGLMRAVKRPVTESARRIRPEEAPHGLAFVNRMVAFVNSVDEPGRLADVCAAGPMFSFGERLTLLQTFDPMERLRLVQQKLGSEHDDEADNSTRTSD